MSAQNPASLPLSIDASPEPAPVDPAPLNGPLAANLGDGANGRLGEAERCALDDAITSAIYLAAETRKPTGHRIAAAVERIVREHTERAWDEGWTRGAKDMNETVRWGETNCERPTNPYAARQEQS